MTHEESEHARRNRETVERLDRDTKRRVWQGFDPLITICCLDCDQQVTVRASGKQAVLDRWRRDHDDRHPIYAAARELVAAANADPNFPAWSKRAYFAVQGIEEALRLRPVWGPSESEVIDGNIAESVEHRPGCSALNRTGYRKCNCAGAGLPA